MNIPEIQSFLKIIPGLLLGIIAIASTTASAQDHNDNSSSETQTETQSELMKVISIEEITVTAERSFFSLRTQIRDSKEKAFSQYNEVNELDEFDVDCRQSDWTGTHLRNQVCWPAFFEEVVAENTYAHLTYGDMLIPTQQLQNSYREEFSQLREHILTIAIREDSVGEAFLEHGKLKEALKRKREECMQRPAFLFIFRICN